MREKITKLLDGRPYCWLARKLGITEVTLRKRLNGEAPFKEAEIIAMSQIFNVDESILREE